MRAPALILVILPSGCLSASDADAADDPEAQGEKINSEDGLDSSSDEAQEATVYSRSGKLKVAAGSPYATARVGIVDAVGYTVAEFDVPEQAQNLSISWPWDATTDVANLDQFGIVLEPLSGGARFAQHGLSGSFEGLVESPATEYQLYVSPESNGVFADITLDILIKAHWVGEPLPR